MAARTAPGPVPHSPQYTGEPAACYGAAAQPGCNVSLVLACKAPMTIATLLPDHDLMHAVLNGDRDALTVLYDRHHAKLFTFLARWTGDEHAAEDLVHEVFLRLLRSGLRYDGRGPFITWLFRVARNLATDRYRRLQGEAGPISAAEAISDDLNPLEQLERSEQQRQLDLALAALPAPHREVLLLRTMLSLSHSALASELECSEGAARVRLHRAVDALRRIWYQQSGEMNDRH